MRASPPWRAHSDGDTALCGQLAIIDLGDWQLAHDDHDDIGIAWARVLDILTAHDVPDRIGA